MLAGVTIVDPTTLTPACRAGYQDGDVGQALFSYPRALAVGADGTLYVAEVGNHRIRRLRRQPRSGMGVLLAHG